MSFGASGTTKTAENNLGGTSNLALNNLFPAVTGAGQANLAGGSGALATGQGNVAAGTNFLNTILGGNQANTTAALQPSIDQIRSGVTNSLQGINTLMPRGGGRSSALFNESLAPQSQIQNLFNQARTSAATALPQIGLQQGQLGLGQLGVGSNLFGIGGNALNTATGANSTLGNLGQTQQQLTNNLFSQLGSGLFGLATTPFGGGSAANGLLGLIKPPGGTGGTGLFN